MRAWRLRQHIHRSCEVNHILHLWFVPHWTALSSVNIPLNLQHSSFLSMPFYLIPHLARPSYLPFWLHLALPRSSTSPSHQNLLINLLIHPSRRSWNLYLCLSCRCSINQKPLLQSGSTDNRSLVEPRKQPRQWSMITQACP